MTAVAGDLASTAKELVFAFEAFELVRAGRLAVDQRFQFDLADGAGEDGDA